MAKKDKNLMHVIERTSKKNGAISFELHCSGKDPLTRKNKVYVKTYHLPPELKGEKKITEFRLKAQIEFKDEVIKKSLGTIAAKQVNIKFIDFAKEWVENILINNKQAYNYYRTCLTYLKTFETQLSNYYLHEMTQLIITKFCKWLCLRTYKKTTVTVTKDLTPIIKEKKLSLRKVAESSNISHATLFVVLIVGKTINKETAAKLCKFLNVPMEKYFNIEIREVSYSKSSNNGTKVMLQGVLRSALRQGLIERNYASRDYIDSVKGTKGKKEIFENIEDIQQFVKCIETETDIRKKVAFSLFINLGLRGAEVAGLEWKDFDFDTNSLTISRNTMYVSGFGIKTKDPKSEKSKRTISVPSGLLALLKKYQTWWDIEKENHGDLWEHTNRLFAQNNGKDMCGMTIANWLKEFQKKHGLKNVTPHGLRHTNITMQISNGVDIKTVSARAGHADIQTTLNIYTHYISEADKKAANKIDELLTIN